TVKLPDRATNNTTQILRIHNANQGTFTLSLPGAGNPTGEIAFNAGKTAIHDALVAAGTGITAVTVSDPIFSGNDRVFTLTFVTPSNPPALLVAGTANLKGTADNGILARADGTSADAHFHAEVFNKSVSVSDGTHPAQTVAQKSIGAISVTVPADGTNTSL